MTTENGKQSIQYLRLLFYPFLPFLINNSFDPVKNMYLVVKIKTILLNKNNVFSSEKDQELMIRNTQRSLSMMKDEWRNNDNT